MTATGTRAAATPRSSGTTERLTVDSVNRLSPLAKARLVLDVVATYCRVRWSLHRVELEPLVEKLRSSHARAEGPLSADAAERVATRLGYVVDRMLRVVPTDAPCLVNSLVLTSLLAAHGVTGRLVIGVTVDPFAAHAWVEHQGRPLLPTEACYRRLVEL